MISLDVAIKLHVTITASDSMSVEDELDLVMEQLVNLTETDCGLMNPALSWDAELSMVTAEATVSGETWEDAVSTFDSCIRAAIHGAGGHTPNWTLEKKAEHAELV